MKNQTDVMDLNMWFQQDGAMSHTAHETITLLHTKWSGGMLISFGLQDHVT